jgi:hypothetical protein
MWFITAICSRETMKRLAERHANALTRPRSSRTFGFYNTHNEAYAAVKENRGSMCEYLYDYIVIEYIEPGIHPTVHVSEWWAWDDAENKWQYLTQEDWPTEFAGGVNWAIG